MISEHSSFTHPSNRTRLWRYLDLSKFVALIQTANLHFARADTLGDPFEGSVPRLNASIAEVIIANREIEAFACYKDMPEHVIRGMFGQLSTLSKQYVTMTHINCWHMGEHESAAMWKLYSQSSDAICIQTTFAKLANELPDFVYAGVVEYIDYENAMIPRGNLFNPFLRKRVSFEHEKELRAVLMFNERLEPWSYPIGGPTDAGALIPVNLNVLIENVFVSPTSAAWFKSVVECVARKYELAAPVHQSSLSGTPLY